MDRRSFLCRLGASLAVATPLGKGLVALAASRPVPVVELTMTTMTLGPARMLAPDWTVPDAAADTAVSAIFYLDFKNAP